MRMSPEYLGRMAVHEGKTKSENPFVSMVYSNDRPPRRVIEDGYNEWEQSYYDEFYYKYGIKP